MAKNMYIGVDNVARKVKQPIIGVDNIARNVKSGFIGVDNVARQFYQSGVPLNNYGVGTIVKLTEDGVNQDYIIVHKGIPQNSSLYHSSCDGIWLLRKDIIADVSYPTTNQPYSAFDISNVKSYLNTTVLSKYTANVQNTIKEIKIPYYGGYGMQFNLYSGDAGCTCKLFLLGVRELGQGQTTNADDDTFFDETDGAKLDYFTTDTLNRRKAQLNGAYEDYYTRTPNIPGDRRRVYYIQNTGVANKGGINVLFASSGVRPALIMPYTALVNSDMVVI